MEYGETLNLPQTDFPMRGNLPQKEPDFLARWEEMDLYALSLEKNSDKPSFILHDGPPYANGDIHLGHVLNKVLKDIIVKYKTMAGFRAPYIPGWDTHGLPIEQRAIKDLGINRHQVSKVEFRQRCHDYAMKYVNIQREQFKRLGVRGDWDDPYLTLDPKFEAVQLGIFGEMAKKGYVYKGLKPVYWCPDCETALAEAEIEYAEHKSASIYVKFPVSDGKGILPADAYLVIWTTTPWTIPANLAVCLHPDFAYVLAEIDGEKLVVAKDLLAGFLKAIDKADAVCNIIKEFKGKELEFCTCRHPLFDRDSLVILGNHVTLEAGTGCVHTAPGHGADDFIVGKQYDLPILSPVDDKGRFTAEAGQFEGLDTKAGNKAVVKALDEAGVLLKFAMFEHQYPHCWRCGTPILFRATEQWFASVDGFREQALKEVDSVDWIPSWGHDRIYNMIRDRGDWCISRQRTWGVPIPIFYCADCGKPLVTDETIAYLQEIVKKEGSSAWFAHEASELMPKGTKCECGSSSFTKETDTMDVWFDSGSSSFAVLEKREGHSWPADLYLEGSDQHRGWFNSSLCIAVATRGKAPYKAVLTHGFIVDEKGFKQSKSKGNATDPHKIIKEMGADVLRLWVASTDYRSDLANSPAIMKQIGESYRKIRNTARYLLGNLYDFDPVKDALPFAELNEMDKYIWIKNERLVGRVLEAYKNYEFHNVYQNIHKFCVVDLSNFYLDVVKDCLYTELADSHKRRSVQTVLYRIADCLMRLLAPVLSFTAEEIYDALPQADKAKSVHLLEMPQADKSCYDEELEAKWHKILDIRQEVMSELEKARKDKVIGHSLDASLEISAQAKHYGLLDSLGDELAKIFIVSNVKLNEGDSFTCQVSPAKGTKCERCWIYSEQIDSQTGLCPRCAEVMKQK